MTKEKVTPKEAMKPDVVEQENAEVKAASPVAEILKSIAALSQVDRLLLYSRLDIIINHDREKASTGSHCGYHLFDEAIKSL